MEEEIFPGLIFHVPFFISVVVARFPLNNSSVSGDRWRCSCIIFGDISQDGLEGLFKRGPFLIWRTRQQMISSKGRLSSSPLQTRLYLVSMHKMVFSQPDKIGLARFQTALKTGCKKANCPLKAPRWGLISFSCAVSALIKKAFKKRPLLWFVKTPAETQGCGLHSCCPFPKLFWRLEQKKRFKEKIGGDKKAGKKIPLLLPSGIN